MRQHTYFEAYLDDFDKIIVFMSKDSYGGISNRFHLKDRFGHMQELSINSIEQTGNNYNKYTLMIHGEMQIGHEYYVVHQFAREAVLEYAYITKTQRFDELYAYEGNDLGANYTKQKTTFVLWAPCASRIKLELIKHGQMHMYEMKREERGVFRLAVEGDWENASYAYFVRVHGEWRESIDPYGVASKVNALRSVVVDLEKIKVKSFPLPEMKSNCDAIIYETSVRDFTKQKGIGVEHAGTFLGFIEENDETKKKKTGFSYLKSLGVTHVQLMPVMDFGSVDELYPTMFYNWCYDPVQWGCLEGSLCSDPENPYARMFEFAKLVETCHENGMRVVLDVVFNHVYDMPKNAMNLIVPNYYFQMNENGEYSNGTFCGNDIDSTRKMCRKLIVDTCLYLCKTFKIDGFRFDLMGILDMDTIKEVYSVCKAYQKDFILYGEGWDMPSLLANERRASIPNHAHMPHVAHFSDRFRDVAKGKTSEYEVNVKGYCSGATYLIDVMKNVMLGSCSEYGCDRMFVHPDHVVNYVECHDNMTCWDKLKECCKEDPREIRIQRQKMCIAAVLLAQGIPFLHSGQEFARTKHGKHNTYNDSDEINQMDYDRKKRYEEIVESTKALIEIRKAYACLRYATQDEVVKNVEFHDIDRKVLIYQTKDESEELMVFFNPTYEQFVYHLPCDYHLLYYNGRSSKDLCHEVHIGAVSTIVLAKSSGNSIGKTSI